MMIGSRFRLPSIAVHSIAPILVKLLGTAAAFLLSVFLARVLGVEDFGAYSLVVSAVMVSSIPIQSGLPILATREVARARASHDFRRIHIFFGWSSRIIFFYAGLMIALVAALALIFPDSEFARNALIAVPAVGTMALTLRNSGAVRGVGQFVRGSIPDVLLRPVVQAIGLLLLFYFATDLVKQPRWALATFIATSGVACLASAIWRRNYLPMVSAPDCVKGPSRTKEWRTAALLLTVVGGGQIFFGHIDTLMLGAIGNESDVGAYRVAVQLSMLVIFALSVVNQVLQPRISELHLQGNKAALQNLLSASSALMFVGTLLPAMILAFMAPFLLEFVFGEEYRFATTALQILIIGQVVNVFFGSVGTILNMTGLEKEATKGMVLAIVINLILDLLLIPPFGINGAALASALTISIWNAVLRYYVKDRLGLESSGVILYSRRFVRLRWLAR